MTDWNDIHPTWKEAIGVHFAFQKLGFSGDEIFVHLNPDQNMLVVLQHEGKQFAITVGQIDLPQGEWESEWTRLAKAVIDGSVPDDCIAEWYNNSIPKQRCVEFLTALLNKGLLPDRTKSMVDKKVLN